MEHVVCSKEKELEEMARKIGAIHAVIVGDGATPGLAEQYRANKATTDALSKLVFGNGKPPISEQLIEIRSALEDAETFRRKTQRWLVVLTLAVVAVGAGPDAADLIKSLVTGLL